MRPWVWLLLAGGTIFAVQTGFRWYEYNFGRGVLHYHNCMRADEGYNGSRASRGCGVDVKPPLGYPEQLERYDIPLWAAVEWERWAK